MKLLLLLAIFSIFFLSSCSGLPLRLQSAAGQSMEYLNAEMSTAIESMNYIKPIMIDSHQIQEDKWCLTYILGPEFRFSSIWEKQEQTWVQIELRPYEGNCNWVRE